MSDDLDEKSVLFIVIVGMSVVQGEPEGRWR